jgi:hypothetical protein
MGGLHPSPALLDGKHLDAFAIEQLGHPPGVVASSRMHRDDCVGDLIELASRETLRLDPAAKHFIGQVGPECIKARIKGHRRSWFSSLEDHVLAVSTITSARRSR